MKDRDDLARRTRDAFRAAREPTGEPRRTPRRPVGDDVVYSRRLEDSWARNHAATGYRGRVAEPPGPDPERELSLAVPEWQRLRKDPQEWPADADPQASPGKPVKPWESFQAV